ncbi:MAG: hypothetical protein ACRD44_11930 [Bryobacteraceae bacterium]
MLRKHPALADGHQVDNTVTAVTALERPGIPVASIERGGISR